MPNIVPLPGNYAAPTKKGLSSADLMCMRAFAEAWPDEAIIQQAVGRLPWGHNLVLLTKLKTPQERLAYDDDGYSV